MPANVELNGTGPSSVWANYVLDAFYSFEKEFRDYLEEHRVEESAEEVGLQLKTKNTVLPRVSPPFLGEEAVG